MHGIPQVAERRDDKVLHVEPETWLDGLAFGDAFEDIADAAGGTHRDRFTSVELSVIRVEFGQ